jgi:hypothetical protein
MLLSALAASTLALTACASVETNGSSEPSASAESQSDAKKNKKGSDKSAAKTQPKMTSSQKNALESAQNYIDLSGFSKKGLIKQLSSKAGDGYSKKDATFAANKVGADWKAEAVESAQNYIDLSGFSKKGLIKQLSSSAGDGYTREQATYAVGKVY